MKKGGRTTKAFRRNKEKTAGVVFTKMNAIKFLFKYFLIGLFILAVVVGIILGKMDWLAPPSVPPSGHSDQFAWVFMFPLLCILVGIVFVKFPLLYWKKTKKGDNYMRYPTKILKIITIILIFTMLSGAAGPVVAATNETSLAIDGPVVNSNYAVRGIPLDKLEGYDHGRGFEPPYDDYADVYPVRAQSWWAVGHSLFSASAASAVFAGSAAMIASVMNKAAAASAILVWSIRIQSIIRAKA